MNNKGILGIINDVLKKFYKEKKFPTTDSKNNIKLIPTVEDIAKETGISIEEIESEIFTVIHHLQKPDSYLKELYLKKLDSVFWYTKHEEIGYASKLEAFSAKSGYSLEQLKDLYSVNGHIISRPSLYPHLPSALSRYFKNLKEQEEKELLGVSETTELHSININYHSNELSNVLNAVYLPEEISNKLSVYKTHKLQFREPNDRIRELERLQKAIPKDLTVHLDDTGIAKINSKIKGGDILIGHITPRIFKTEEERLLSTIFGEHTYQNSSITVPKNINGTIIDVINYYGLITFYIREDFPLEYGDIVENSNGTKAIYYGVSKEQPKYVVSNSTDFNGTIIKRDCSNNARPIIKARSFGSYRKICPWKFLDTENDLPYETITKNDIKKFINNGKFDVLQNILSNTLSEKRRDTLGKEVLKSGDVTSTVECNEEIIRILLHYSLALGAIPKLSIASNKKITMDDLENVIQGADLLVSTTPLTDKKIEIFSSGEISSDYSNSDNGIFSKDIFGEEIFESNDFGHIDLPIRYPNFAFENIYLTKLLVMPPKSRCLNDDKVFEEKIDSALNHILSLKKRLTYSRASDLFISQIERDCYHCTNKLFCNNLKHTNIYQGISCDIFDIIADAFINNKATFSGSARAVINSSLSNDVARIPLIIAKEIFAFNIIHYLVSNKFVKTKKEAFFAIENDKFKGEIIKAFENKEIPTRMFLMSSNETGDVIELTPTITEYNVIELSKDNFIKLRSRIEDIVKIFALPKSIVFQSDYEPIKINNEECERFYSFFDKLSTLKNDKFNYIEKGNFVKDLILTMSKENVANSIAFCLLSGRNLKENLIKGENS